MIEISLNNQLTTLAANLNVAEMMATLGYGQQQCAVAINGDFVPRSQYQATPIRHGDLVDIVAPVGGG